jgi:putative alpha-1,2-mannosidase
VVRGPPSVSVSVTTPWGASSPLGCHSLLSCPHVLTALPSVDPASATYVIGAPFFDSLTLRLPGARRPLRITARGASSGAKYVRGVTIDGKPHRDIMITHEQIRDGADIVFDMQQTPQVWGK